MLEIMFNCHIPKHNRNKVCTYFVVYDWFVMYINMIAVRLSYRPSWSAWYFLGVDCTPTYNTHILLLFLFEIDLWNIKNEHFSKLKLMFSRIGWIERKVPIWRSNSIYSWRRRWSWWFWPWWWFKYLTLILTF